MANIIFVYKGRYFVRDTETISYLSAISKHAGYNTDLVYDPDIFGITDNVLYMPLLNKIFSSKRHTLRKILATKPDIIVFLANFNNSDWIKEMLDFIHLHSINVKTVVISPLGEKFKYANYELVGQPEEVWSKFLCVDVSKNLIPDKDIFSKYVNFAESYMVYTSRGCIGSCSYCEETIFKKLFLGYYYRRSVENVIEELFIAKNKYKPKEVIFKDSVFTADKKWLFYFLKEYRKVINIPFKCFGRADVFDEEIAFELKTSECYCIEFGVQTLNEEIRKNILLRRETIEDIKRAFTICDKYKLLYDIDHMFGLPNETVDDHKLACKFYSQFKCINRIKCHNLVVYQQSEIKKYINKEVITSPDFFTTTAGTKSMRYINICFQKLFKVLPLINKTILDLILKYNLWKVFYFIPEALIMFAQLIIAIKHKDKRFKVYLKLYPLKLKTALEILKA